MMLMSLAAPLLANRQAVTDTQENAVPKMDELAGEWKEVLALRSLPALNSSFGSGKVTENALAVGDLSFPPLTMPGVTGQLSVNGQDVSALMVRWYPHQVLRSAESGNVIIETAVRMPYTAPGLLFRIRLTNQGAHPQTLDLQTGLSAAFSPHTSWGWDIPRSTAPGQTLLADEEASLSVSDPAGDAWGCFCFAQKPDRITTDSGTGKAHWLLTLPPGQTQTIEYVLAAGRTAQAAKQQAQVQAASFGQTFQQAETDWQVRFDAMFQPGNSYFSGSLPRLVTSDRALKQSYYVSIVSLLSVCRTCFPIAPRVYVTNTPEYNCTMMYFWDTREFATVLALLDPVMMKQYLEGWLKLGIHKGYAEEFLTGTLQGPWYSANDISIFILLNTYLNVTRDSSFLSEVIGGQTILQHMEAIATYWKKLVRPGQTLADYGNADNLLECVPTYIHEVPSFNAANVWMMRRTADLLEAHDESSAATALRQEANHLLPAVLALYVPGQGVWESRRADGTKVQMRHVLDFVTVGQMITSDLTPIMRQEMAAFVERELLADHWMRAQSLSDSAAAFSNRPDHGPMGAFTAWPAETMATFCAFGRFDLALSLLHRCASVLTEGPFSQSRELLDKTPESPVRIASRGDQTYNASCSGSFAESVIRSFFGYQPDLLSEISVPDRPPRPFDGKLLAVRNGDKLYSIISESDGLNIFPRGNGPLPVL